MLNDAENQMEDHAVKVVDGVSSGGRNKGRGPVAGIVANLLAAAAELTEGMAAA